ncbi:MAG: hypothetical protein VZR00_02915 [Lachnospiraceae bacterium]|nr:hypothetical protein [Lachnospiraceae bacterium]MEE3460828.1 hypothetical protein [Lachnospiraceae bacterium]
MNLIRYELKKINALSWIVVALCLLALCGLLFTFLLENQNESDWHDYAKKHRAELQKMIDMTDSDDPNYDTSCSVFRSEIDLIDYSLENDLPYGCQSVWTYLHRSRFLLGIVTIIMILISGNSITVEYNCRMFEKILSGRYTFFRLMRTKLFMLWSLTCLSYIAGEALLFLIGYIRYGLTGNTISPVLSDDIIIKQNLVTCSTLYVFVLFLATLIYIDLALILEIVFPNKKIIPVSVILLLLFNGTLASLSEKMGIAEYLPLYYLDAARFADGLHNGMLTLQVAYLLCLFGVLTVLVFFAAKRFIYKK